MSASTLTPQDVEQLNTRFEAAHPTEIIRWAAETFRPLVAMTSSFGAKSAALLHLGVQVDPTLEVRFVDTGVLFPETLQFKNELQQRLKLNIKTFTSILDVDKFLKEHEGQAVGHPDFCCSPWKVEATERALDGLRCWITGITRSEAKTRTATPFVEVLTTGTVKVAPLAAWTDKHIHDYMVQHKLLHHPLWEKGYTSIGCWPCTQKPVDPNDPRSGRWAGQDKTECGIHDIGKSTSPKKKSS